MIVKNPKFKYDVKFVKKGTGKNNSYWTRFSIGDYDSRRKKATFVNVMVFDDLSIQDGDSITFNDYQVGFHTHNGRVYGTIYATAEDIEIVDVAEDTSLDLSENLPFNIEGEDDLPF